MRTRRYAAALAGLLLAPVLAACDTGDVTVPGSDLNRPSDSPSASTGTAASGSSTGSSGGRTFGPSGPPPHRISDDCDGPITVSRATTQPRLFYALRFSLAPGSSTVERHNATLYTYPPLSPGVLVLEPLREEPRTPLEQSVLSSLLDRGTTVLEGQRELRWSVTNRTGRTARYLAWAGATVSTTAWSRACPSDGSRISGTAIQVGAMRSGVSRCGERAAPTASVESRRLVADAERQSCQRDSYESAPFRTLPSRVQAGPS